MLNFECRMMNVEVNTGKLRMKNEEQRNEEGEEKEILNIEC
jgi:hypothetical protein